MPGPEAAAQPSFPDRPCLGGDPSGAGLPLRAVDWVEGSLHFDELPLTIDRGDHGAPPVGSGLIWNVQLDRPRSGPGP